MAKFINYCKENFSLVAFVIFCAFVAFSAKLFLFTVGIDIEMFIANQSRAFIDAIGMNRVVFVLLRNILHINSFNPFYSSIIAIIFLILSVLSWSFFVSKFDNKQKNKLPFWAFASITTTSPIWAEQLQFAAAEVFIGIFLVPFVAIILIDGFKQKSKNAIILATISMGLLFCIYQSIAVLFILAYSIATFFICQAEEFDKKLPIKILVCFLVSLLIFYIVGKLSILALDIERHEYISAMLSWNFASIRESLLNIAGFAYILTFAKIEPLHAIISSAFLSGTQYTASTGMSVADRSFELSRVFGSITLLPLTIAFFICAFKEKSPNNKLYYFSAMIFIPLSIFMLSIFLGNMPPFRSLLVFPFVFGFLFYFVISRSKNFFCIKTFSILAFIVALHFSQISSALFYSDNHRFRQDLLLAQQVDLQIRKIGTQNKSKAIAFVGRRELQKNSNFTRGEVLGFSQFNFDVNNFFESSIRGVYFMQSLGMNYSFPDSVQMKKARELANTMPIFPQSGSIKIKKDFVIVKLSESTFLRVE